MSLRMMPKVEIRDFIDSVKFAEMMGITYRKLSYRLSLNQVHPMPVLFGYKYIYEPGAKIVIPEHKKGGGRPHGSSIANGAKSPGGWKEQKGRNLLQNRGRKRKVK